jgi:hypothetical protein
LRRRAAYNGWRFRQRETAMPLQVIGAGLSRTGTLSLKLALEQLGFGPCFHMLEFVKPQYEPRRRLWERAMDGEAADWEAIFAGFSSAVDMPACLYYRKLSRAYPLAHVILTVRDPASWYRSSLATVWGDAPSGPTGTPDRNSRAAKLKAANLREVGFDILEDPRNEALTTALFNRYNEQVKHDVSPERLLVFDVEDGWEPLCAFFGVAVPQTPFPRENSAAEFQTHFGSASRP